MIEISPWQADFAALLRPVGAAAIAKPHDTTYAGTIAVHDGVSFAMK
jgi:hypothetical protein